jgi:hypothetical protein
VIFDLLDAPYAAKNSREYRTCCLSLLLTATRSTYRRHALSEYGAVWVPSSRVTVQNLELGPFNELQQGGLRLAHRERGRTEEGAWDGHGLL